MSVLCSLKLSHYSPKLLFVLLFYPHQLNPKPSEPVIHTLFFFSSRRRHTRWPRDWSSDVCSSDLNIVVAKSLIEAAKDLELAYEYDFDTLDRGGEDFIQASREFGEKICRLGNKFKEAHRAEEKVNILADLALLVSQDGAGLSFMSNKLQKDVGSAGMLKGTSAVISLLVTEEYIRNYKIPYITETDTKNYKVIIKKAIMLLHQNLEKAEKELREKFDFKPEAYSYLFK